MIFEPRSPLGRMCAYCQSEYGVNNPVWEAANEDTAYEVCEHNHFVPIKSIAVYVAYQLYYDAGVRLLVLWQTREAAMLRRARARMRG